MADQDFNINIRTLADLTGIKLTQQGLDAIQQSAKQGNIASIEALKKLTVAQKEAATQASSVSSAGGFTGTAIGVGTIVTLLTHAVTAWKRFEDEQDKIIQKMEEAREKTYELGLSVADTLEEIKSAARIDTEPLEASFGRLTHDVAVLKSELQTAFETGAYEDAKKYIAQLRSVESQLDRVTSAIKRQSAEAERSRQENVQKQEETYGAASPQAKAILENEKRARETGDQAFQKTADRLRASATPADLAAVQAVTDSYGKAPRPGRAAEVGESQDLVDEMERQRIAAEKQNKLTDQAQDQQQEPPPAPLTNPAPKEDMIANPIDDKTIGAQASDIIQAIVHLEGALLGLWR